MEEAKLTEKEVEKVSEFNMIINSFEKELNRFYCITQNISERINRISGVEPEDGKKEASEQEPNTIIKKLNSLLLAFNNINSKLEHCDNRLTNIVGKL